MVLTALFCVTILLCFLSFGSSPSVLDPRGLPPLSSAAGFVFDFFPLLFFLLFFVDFPSPLLPPDSPLAFAFCFLPLEFFVDLTVFVLPRDSLLASLHWSRFCPRYFSCVFLHGFDRASLPSDSLLVSVLRFLSLGFGFLMDLTVLLCYPVPFWLLSFGVSPLVFCFRWISPQGFAARFSFCVCPFVSVY